MAEVKKFGKLSFWVSTIFLGSVGSACYDIFLKDFFYNLGGGFVRVASTFFAGYVDRLYDSVGSQHDGLLYVPGIVILTAMMMLPIFYYLRLMKKLRLVESYNNDVNIDPSKLDQFLRTHLYNYKRLRLVTLIPTVIIAILYADMLIRYTSCSAAVSVVKRRLDIVRPYISENASNKLNSDFRLVDDRQKLQNLVNEIDGIAKNNHLKMPEIRLYGINSIYYRKI